MEWIALAVLVIIVIAFISVKVAGKAKQLPYESIHTLFTPAERSFYGVLNLAVKDRLIVFGKVRVADVIKTRKGLNNSDRQTAHNKIDRKHFDFVLCRPDDLSIVCAVELDDSSHNSKKRIARDKFLDAACASANLTLHHFPAKRSYNTKDIASVIFPEEQTVATSTLPPEKTEELSPTLELGDCPKCSAKLVKQVAKKGGNIGSEFLACSTFPKCRYTT